MKHHGNVTKINGAEDLQKAVWYIERLIGIAGGKPDKRKELFTMTQTASKHGIEVKREFTIGGIAFTVIQTEAERVKVITSSTIGERAFDSGNKNDFAASNLRAYLNGEFMQKLIEAGAPEEMFEEFEIDLTADDGLKQYGKDRARVGLITCDEYRALRENIPPLPNTWWWTATPDSPVNSYVRFVDTGGSLGSNSASYGYNGVRPLCVLKSEILVSFLDGDALETAQEQNQQLVHEVCRLACESVERDMALARLEADVEDALREQVEREKGCEHCRGWDSRCGASYCPMCGRRLDDKP